MGYFGRYITKHGQETLNHYTYRGSDDSLLYKYINSPMYEVMIQYVPNTIAPNVITLLGLACTFTTYFIQEHYSPNMDQVLPAWVYMISGIAIWMYQTLDALDGKQARKTGSSSPLGLLFDHGCDAINNTIISLSIATALQLGPTHLTAILWSAQALGFFMATLEEYYTGELHLPIINGPSEGLLLAAVAHSLTYFQDPTNSFWLRIPTWSYGLQHNELAVLLIVVGAFFTILSNIVNIFNAVTANAEKEGSNPMNLKEPGTQTYIVALTRCLVVALLTLGAWFWLFNSPTDIMGRHPRLVIWTLGLLISKLLTSLMLAHLCEEEYRPWGKTFTAVFAMACHALINFFAYTYKFGSPSEEVMEAYEDLMLYEIFVVSLCMYIHFSVYVAHDVSTALGIYVFTLGKRPTEKGKEKKID
ncbi:hypothetical protein SARC_03694 [Sphaeroforma arctica JP610]|uniref:CDP-alcohol phosphatidyltransferase n=1 Tax=Sphaeroforma arctica JP610 TaxID=667725 RepID=A0A0L0G5J2_9EUKA|nr:hypothetical protein SARC_03694 [Sphaeroforma arctica JP610]KNC84066.1 hypothetical protein SARC_03694 [Sphaeroforma arctica JP610]|eukprot:XP_014157968.1 hypothetical protein SARC_03694 [Sphaeroforma arctica JP610]